MKRNDIQFARNNRFVLKNRSTLQWVVLLISLWSILFKPISLLSGPLSYLKYVPDGILLLLLVIALCKKRISLKRTLLAPLCIVLTCFSLCLIVGVFRYQSAAYFLWGFRNNFRFYIAFFSFIAWLDEFDAALWFKTMDVFFWINAGLSAIQFFFMGIKGDYLGGIFGILGASNGFTLCFMSIVLGKSLLEAFAQKKRITDALIKSIVAILVATMAEMKFFFFVVVFLLVGATILTGFSFRKMIVILMGMIALSFGAVVLVDMFGFEGFFSLEKLWESAIQENYSSSGDINRLSAIKSLILRIGLNPIDQIFGLGLGNCDTSAFAVCNTPFFQQYGHLHYTWFVSAMLFLETGYLGLGLYICFFVICFVKAYRNYRARSGNVPYNQLAILVSGLCIILVFYDSSLRVESGYMMYFVLALPFIRQKSAQTAPT